MKLQGLINAKSNGDSDSHNKVTVTVISIIISRVVVAVVGMQLM